MKINHSVQINSLLKMIPLPHFLENYFADVKIKNDPPRMDRKRVGWDFTIPK